MHADHVCGLCFLANVAGAGVRDGDVGGVALPCWWVVSAVLALRMLLQTINSENMHFKCPGHLLHLSLASSHLNACRQHLPESLSVYLCSKNNCYECDTACLSVLKMASCFLAVCMCWKWSPYCFTMLVEKNLTYDPDHCRHINEQTDRLKKLVCG